MFRASSFNIIVNIPRSSDVILVNGLTGAIDQIDAEIARYIDAEMPQAERSNITELRKNSVNYLTERGYITTLDEQAELKYAESIMYSLEANELNRHPTFYLMPTYDCQLRCTYCFEHGTRNIGHRQGWADRRIEPEVISAAFAAMDKISPNPIHKTCTLYGGEPLMPENVVCVKKIIQVANQYGYSIMAASNAFDLQNFFDVLGPKGIAGLHVPVDGNEITHDKLRFSKSRKQTFKRIIENISEALERGVRVRMRINANREVLNNLEIFADELEYLGFTQSPLFSCYVKAIFPIKSSLSKGRSMITDADIADALASSVRLSKIFSGYPVFHHRIDSLFFERSRDALRPYHCGASNGKILVFDPFGYIFPCNNVVGDQMHHIGRYYPSFYWDELSMAKWSQRTVPRIPDTKNCKYALFCGGGCHYDALVAHGEINVTSCNCTEFARTFKGLIISTYQRILSDSIKY